MKGKDDLLNDEQLAATGFWKFVEHPTEGCIRMTEPPVRYSKSSSSIRRLQPRLGEHSNDLLAEAGYSDEEIQAFFESGVSAQPN